MKLQRIRGKYIPTDLDEGPGVGDFADALFGADTIYARCAQDAAERFYASHARGRISFYRHPRTRRWMVALHDDSSHGSSHDEFMSLETWCAGRYRQMVFDELNHLLLEQQRETTRRETTRREATR